MIISQSQSRSLLQTEYARETHINDVQAAYQLLLYVLESSHIKDKSHINDVFAADGQHR